VYVAQPPLYKIKQGRSEVYIKDDKEFSNEILRRAMRNIQVEVSQNGGGRKALERGELQKLLLSLEDLTQIAPKLERRLRDPRVVELLLDTSLKLDRRDEVTSPREEVPESLTRLKAKMEEVGLNASLSWDEESSAHGLTYLDSTQAERQIGVDLFQSPEYRRFRVIARDIAGTNFPPFTVKRGDASDEILNWQALLEAVKKEGMKDASVQRYKGLGEMNAEQLWETTMNAEQRTLLQVRLEDIVECEEIFSTLMGENVESRRKFIEDNALDVKHLDI
ncbi:MAG: DNA gyrase subunit B, partial [Bryobacterales bacterium]|nr:DNA gyrase subunit B [Bryobacterales bacterium]